MSYTTITQSTVDQHLRNRLAAAIAKETYGNVGFGASVTGQRVKREGPVPEVDRFIWAIAVDNEAAYAFAVANNNSDPGGDAGVITDANLASGVQAHWPDSLS